MPRNEVQAFFEHESDWESMTPAERLIAGRLLNLRGRLQLKQETLHDLRTVDELGPWFRIGLLIDRLSGSEGRWVSADEVIEAFADDQHLQKWIDEVAASCELDQRTVVTEMVDAWCELVILDDMPTPTIVETSFATRGAMWRSISLDPPPPPAAIGELIEHLVTEHAGTAHGAPGSRHQVSLDDLELFVGIELDPSVTEITLDEAPLTLSALSGIEVLADPAVDDVISAFRADPATPSDLSITLTRGIGDQVWVDRALTPALLDRLSTIDAVDELIIHARRLADSLRPWECNPPSASATND